MKTFILVPAFLALAALPATSAPDDMALASRLTWGPTADGQGVEGQNAHHWLEQQLHPSDDDDLPPQAQAQIAALSITAKPMEQIAIDMKQLQLQVQAA
ncbi:MAG TPA: hypothetical protein VFQ52_06510, partial [Rhizomicrobium sp.]|nr:hypothetical protein [Rhizomicrobium sp.]